jgi:hypothetical protein
MAQLLADDGTEGDNFGAAVSISQDASTIVVGAYYDDVTANTIDSGSAYLFRYTNSSTTGEWTLVRKLVATDPNINDFWGTSVAIENDVVVVGANGDNNNTGAVYVVDTGYSLTPTADPTLLQPTTERPIEEKSNTKSDNSSLTIAAGVVTGVVIAVLLYGVFKYRHYKKEVLGRQQAMGTGEPTAPTSFSTSSGNNASATHSDSETPVIVDAVVVLSHPTQPVMDRTVMARAYLDPATIISATPAVRNETADVLIEPKNSTTHRKMELPLYKDQVFDASHGPSGMRSSDS